MRCRQILWACRRRLVIRLSLRGRGLARLRMRGWRGADFGGCWKGSLGRCARRSTTRCCSVWIRRLRKLREFAYEGQLLHLAYLIEEALRDVFVASVVEMDFVNPIAFFFGLLRLAELTHCTLRVQHDEFAVEFGLLG